MLQSYQGQSILHMEILRYPLDCLPERKTSDWVCVQRLLSLTKCCLLVYVPFT